MLPSAGGIHLSLLEEHGGELQGYWYVIVSGILQNVW